MKEGKIMTKRKRNYHIRLILGFQAAWILANSRFEGYVCLKYFCSFRSYVKAHPHRPNVETKAKIFFDVCSLFLYMYLSLVLLSFSLSPSLLLGVNRPQLSKSEENSLHEKASRKQRLP